MDEIALPDLISMRPRLARRAWKKFIAQHSGLPELNRAAGFVSCAIEQRILTNKKQDEEGGRRALTKTLAEFQSIWSNLNPRADGRAR